MPTTVMFIFYIYPGVICDWWRAWWPGWRRGPGTPPTVLRLPEVGTTPNQTLQYCCCLLVSHECVMVRSNRSVLVTGVIQAKTKRSIFFLRLKLIIYNLDMSWRLMNIWPLVNHNYKIVYIIILDHRIYSINRFSHDMKIELNQKPWFSWNFWFSNI